MAMEPVGLPELLSSVKGSVAVLGPRRFSLASVPDVVVLADREQLRGAIVNLVDNAVHATSENSASGSRVRRERRSFLSCAGACPGSRS